MKLKFLYSKELLYFLHFLIKFVFIVLYSLLNKKRFFITKKKKVKYNYL